jgi:cytochrome c553
MAAALVIAALVVLGVAVAFVAFTGGPSRAREAYLTGGRRAFKIVIPIIFVAFGIAVPILVVVGRPAAEGSSGALADKSPNKEFQRGKTLFRQTCWSCHTLSEAGAHGVTGPNLDQIGPVTQQRVLNAIKIGGTGQGRMPAGLLQGADAQAVAYYVSHVAGQ